MKHLLRNETGASMLEYALIAALVAVVAITTVTMMGQEVSKTFNTVANGLKTANN